MTTETTVIHACSRQIGGLAHTAELRQFQALTETTVSCVELRARYMLYTEVVPRLPHQLQECYYCNTALILSTLKKCQPLGIEIDMCMTRLGSSSHHVCCTVYKETNGFSYTTKSRSRQEKHEEVLTTRCLAPSCQTIGDCGLVVKTISEQRRSDDR